MTELTLNLWQWKDGQRNSGIIIHLGRIFYQVLQSLVNFKMVNIIIKMNKWTILKK